MTIAEKKDKVEYPLKNSAAIDRGDAKDCELPLNSYNVMCSFFLDSQIADNLKGKNPLQFWVDKCINTDPVLLAKWERSPKALKAHFYKMMKNGKDAVYPWNPYGFLLAGKKFKHPFDKGDWDVPELNGADWVQLDEYRCWYYIEELPHVMFRININEFPSGLKPDRVLGRLDWSAQSEDERKEAVNIHRRLRAEYTQLKPFAKYFNQKRVGSVVWQ